MSDLLVRIGKACIMAMGLTFAEKKILQNVGLGFLTESSGFPAGGAPLPNASSFLPRGYGLVILVVTISYLWLSMMGLRVGGQRSKYIELAKKDGEKDVEARYALPNLYAQGTSKHAKAFNCVQRSHQQILETFPGYISTVLFTGLEYPVTSFCLAAMWLYSRKHWADGYCNSNGEPVQRYSLRHSRLFWHSMMSLAVTSLFVGVQQLLGRQIFW